MGVRRSGSAEMRRCGRSGAERLRLGVMPREERRSASHPSAIRFLCTVRASEMRTRVVYGLPADISPIRSILVENELRPLQDHGGLTGIESWGTVKLAAKRVWEETFECRRGRSWNDLLKGLLLSPLPASAAVQPECW